MRVRPPLRFLLVPAVTLVVCTARAQTSADTGTSSIPDLVSGLSYVSLSQEITGAVYRVDSQAPGFDGTRFRTFKLPWERDVDVGSEWGTLYLEAVAGWLQAEDHAEIDTPAGLAVVDQDWTTYGGLVGVGWTFHLSDTWSIRPSSSVALTRIENDASYNAVAQEELAPALDGISLNWSGWSTTTLTSLSVLNERELGPVHMRVRARWSYAETNVFESSAPSQEGTDASKSLALRGDLSGELPLSLAGQPIQWGVHTGFTQFYGIDPATLGFDQVAETGGSLTFPVGAHVPDLRLSGAVLYGPDIQGWSFGLSLAF